MATTASPRPVPAATVNSALPPVLLHMRVPTGMPAPPTMRRPLTVVVVRSPLERTTGMPSGTASFLKANSRVSCGSGRKKGVFSSSHSMRATTSSSSSAWGNR